MRKSAILLSVNLLSVILLLGFVFCPIMQEVQACDEAEDETEVDLSVLEYDIDIIIEILGIEEYKNMDLELNPTIKTIEAAKDELLVRLEDDQPVEIILDIAAGYQMEVLRRSLPDTPLFHLRFIQDIELDWTLEEVWLELLGDERIYYVEPNAILELF